MLRERGRCRRDRRDMVGGKGRERGRRGEDHVCVREFGRGREKDKEEV
jgi:hypothetical protein